MIENRYPFDVRRVVTVLWVGLLLFSGIEYLLAWLRSLYAWLFVPLHLPIVPFLDPYENVDATLITAHVGLLVALMAVRVLVFLAPQTIAHSDGLYVHTPLGNRLIPYESVRGVRSAELQPGGRFVVWVNATKALPLHDLFAWLLFGRWEWRGLLITSDLDGFDQIVATIAAQLKQKYGAANLPAHFVETEPTWLMRMLNAPAATIRQVVHEEILPITERQAIWHTASITGALLVPFIIGSLIHLQFPWAAVIVALIAVLEVPLVAVYLTEMPLDSMRRMELNDALRVYPLTQLPRWGVALGLTLLVIAGVPFYILAFLVVAALIPGCYSALKLTEAWFEVKFPESLIGVGGTVIYQMIMFELLILLMPR